MRIPDPWWSADRGGFPAQHLRCTVRSDLSSRPPGRPQPGHGFGGSARNGAWAPPTGARDRPRRARRRLWSGGARASPRRPSRDRVRAQVLPRASRSTDSASPTRSSTAWLRRRRQRHVTTCSMTWESTPVGRSRFIAVGRLVPLKNYALAIKALVDIPSATSCSVSDATSTGPACRCCETPRC